MSSENKIELKVIDTGQIAYLIILGIPFTTEVKKVPRTGKNKVIFVFSVDEKDENILDKYWNSEFYKFKQELDSVRKIIESIKENQS